LFVLAYATALAAPTALRAQTLSTCGAPERREQLHTRFEQLMVSDDSETTVSRLRYQLPRVSPDSVRIITDEQICERAARQYYREYLGPPPLGGVVVIHVGDMYVVYGAKRGGEWTSLEIYTRDFEYVAGFLS
jgi:hypothetical protein